MTTSLLDLVALTLSLADLVNLLVYRHLNLLNLLLMKKQITNENKNHQIKVNLGPNMGG